MQKYVRRINVNFVDLVKSFRLNIFLQNLAPMQKRTSPIKFAHLAEKSEKGSISNLSIKVPAGKRAGRLGSHLLGLPRQIATPSAASPSSLVGGGP